VSSLSANEFLLDSLTCLEDECVGERRDVDEERPEVDVESGRVFENEDRDVFEDGHGEQGVHKLNGENVFREKLEVTKLFVERAPNGESDLEINSNQIVDDHYPTEGSHQFVE
jgi:hypothetical protein